MKNIDDVMTKKSKVVIGSIVTIMIILCISGCVEEHQQEVSMMELSSPAFEHEGTIPFEYTCDGADISPALTFTDIPGNTESLVLIMDDPDAPAGTWVHWLVWNIPPSSKGFSKGEIISYPQGTNDFGILEYGGPCPPSGTHRYFFKLYALDMMLDLDEGASKQELETAISGHIIQEVQLMGLYSR